MSFRFDNILPINNILSGMLAVFNAFTGTMSQQPSITSVVISDVTSDEQEYITNFYMSNPMATARDGHYAWCSKKESDGWKRGDVYDADRKLHPSLVLFEELPGHLQLKNSLTQQTVATLVKALPVSDGVKTGLEVAANVAAAVTASHDSGSDSSI